MPNIETQKVKSFRQVNDPRLLLREGQTAFFQPFRQNALHTLGIFPGFTKADEIVRVPHNCSFANDLASIVIFDANGLFHAVQRNICQQRRHDPTLRGSLLCCMKCPMFDVSSFQPLFDQFLPRDRTNGFKQIVVRNVVECPPDVGVENPLLGFVRSGQAVDFLNSIMAASTWSESVATSFKPGFPGRFKSVLDHCLEAAIKNGGNSERS